MLGIIYCAKNLINGKIYIGQTISSLKRRISCHYHAARQNDNLYFHKALRKYNREDFEWTILKEIDVNEDILKEHLNYWEIYYINLYHSNDTSIGYNLTKGGDAQLEQAIAFWKSEDGINRRKYLSDYWTNYWRIDENRENHKQWMNDFYKSDEGIAQASRHSDWMHNYYNGENARINKAKTSKWFVEAISPDDEKIIFISSKEPNIYFNRDIGLRTILKNIGDIWIPSNRSNLHGWKFKAIEKNYELL